MNICQTYAVFRDDFAEDPDPGVDGYPVWPVWNLEQPDFNGGLSGLPAPITAFPITVSVDGQANGSEGHRCYLSQRTDEPTARWLDIQWVSGKSGTWTISLTSACVAALGLGSATDTLVIDQVERILKYCSLYVQKISNQHTQHFDLLEMTLAFQGED